MENDRSWSFIEFLSAYLVVFSSVGAMLVMIDPVVTFTTDSGVIVKLGGGGFAEQMKGAVTQLVLIGGFTAVIAFWLRISKSEERVQEAISTIAQAAAPSQAAAVAASRAPAPTEAVLPKDTVTPAPMNPATGNIPAAETAQPPQPEVQPSKV